MLPAAGIEEPVATGKRLALLHGAGDQFGDMLTILRMLVRQQQLCRRLDLTGNITVHLIHLRRPLPPAGCKPEPEPSHTRWRTLLPRRFDHGCRGAHSSRFTHPVSPPATTPATNRNTGWDLHKLRHSGLTHLGEAGASLLELMAKSRHRKVENLRRYFKPSPQAMRELTSILGPGAERRR
jgi:hypothetical protein